MAYVDPKVASTVAHMIEVKAAVRAKRDEIAVIAEGLFASHDRPGRHELTKTDPAGTGTDAFLNLEGPNPLAVEFGHWTKDHKKHVEGLHILGRAIGQVTA